MSVSTWAGLKMLGFRKNPDLWADPPTPCGLSFHFGIFKLDVDFVMNLRLRQVAWLHGIIWTPRLIGEVEWEMPLEVESIYQCMAWVTWGLDKYAADNGVFEPTLPVPWLEGGRRY